MNWTRIAIAGVAAGLVTWISDFVQHGMVMAATYQRLSQVFKQTETNPAWFLLISVTICLMVAILFARTRGSWAAGWKGGLSFGFFLGLVIFFQRFFDPLVVDGYPYYLAWCQGGMSMIDSLLAGAVIGSIVKS
ncbi:MAG: hypothetical protein JJE39_03285 [Vicinamibacteria bacterium]|nr:hypothetical protein [Vicinamibacteria bacterium]